MLLDEMKDAFIDSRKRGTGGARCKCSPRTIEVYERNLGIFFNWLLEEKTLNSYRAVKRSHLAEFLDYVDSNEAKGKWSRSTVLQLMRALRTFFRWVDADDDCREEGYRGLQKHLPAIGKTPRREFVPEQKDLKRLKASFKVETFVGFRDYVASLTLLGTGMRIGELCNLTVNDCMLQDRVLYLKGKTGNRAVPITPDLVRLLKAWMKRRTQWESGKDSSYLFTSRKGGRMNENAWAKHFRQHREKHGLAHITPHTLRHTFCTHYLKNGGNIAKLRNISGHKSLHMLMDYVHLAEIGSKEAQEELERVSPLKGL